MEIKVLTLRHTDSIRRPLPNMDSTAVRFGGFAECIPGDNSIIINKAQYDFRGIVLSTEIIITLTDNDDGMDYVIEGTVVEAGIGYITVRTREGVKP